MKAGVPEISIIIPVYNVEKYLDRCIKSVLAQTFTDYEMILVDDCSTDKCPELCDNWAKKDGRIHVIHKAVNGGLSGARNSGLEKATGRYVAFIDSDDWIENVMYERLHNLICRYDADVCLSEWQSNTGCQHIELLKDPIVEVWDQSKYLDYFFRIHGEKSNYSVWTSLFRKDFLEGFTFIEGRIHEDVLASFYFASHCNRVVHTNEVFYNYYQNPEGITRTGFTRKKLDLLVIWDMIETEVRKRVPKYIKPCVLNKKRAYFTLLTRMHFDGYDHADPEMQKIKKYLKRQVRLYFWDLIKWKMPLSRKVLLVAVCIV